MTVGSSMFLCILPNFPEMFYRYWLNGNNCSGQNHDHEGFDSIRLKEMCYDQRFSYE